MKYILFIVLSLATASSAFAAGQTWCSCKTVRGIEINPVSRDQFWPVAGSPQQNDGRACGRGGFILNSTDNEGGFEWLGPLSRNLGNFKSCFINQF